MVEIRYCGYCYKTITDEDQAYYHKPWYTWYCSLDHAIADGAFEDEDEDCEPTEEDLLDYDEDDDYDDYDYDDEDEDDYDYDYDYDD